VNEKDVPSPATLDKRSRLAFLLKDTVLYGGAAAISKAFALVTFPLLARHFSVESYGIVDFFLMLTAFLGVFFIFGQDSAVARFFYEYEDRLRRRQLISQSLAFQLSLVALFVPLMHWQADRWSSLLIDAPERSTLLSLVLLQLPFVVLINFSRNLLKWTFARGQFLVMSLGVTIVQAILLVLAVLIYDASVKDIIMVCLISNILFGLLGVYLIRRWLTLPTDMHYLRELVPFAIPYVIIGGLAAFVPTLERSLIDRLLEPEDLGFYAVATKIAMLLGIVVQAFQTAWGPFAMSLYKKADAIGTYNLVLKAFTWIICVVVLGLSLIAVPMIQILASERYIAAAVVVFPLAMGLAMQAIGGITEIGIGISKRTHFSLVGHLAHAAIVVTTIPVLAPRIGILGVGVSVMIGLGLRALISTGLAQKVYPMKWEFLPSSVVLMTTLTIGSLAVFVQEQQKGNLGHGLLAFGVAAVLGAGWLLLFSAGERKKILGSLLSRVRNI